MSSIPHGPEQCQPFSEYYSSLVRRRRHRYYHAASLNAVQLTNAQFVVYSRIAIAANFGDRIADFRRWSRLMRSWRSKRQIDRILGQLCRLGYIQRHGQKRYSLRGRVQWSQGSRLRPLSPHLLHTATDTAPALYARLTIALAASRLPWGRITWQWVRRALGCDTGLAQHLYGQFCEVRQSSTRAACRRAVFWSSRPEWQRYVTSSGQVKFDCRPGAAALVRAAAGGRRRSAGSDYVPPGVAVIGSIARGVLTRTGGLQPSAGDLSGSGPAGPVGGPARQAAVRPEQEHIAAGLARRRADRRHRDRLNEIARSRPASKRAALTGGDLEKGPDRGSVYESLIAGLPDNIRGRFEQEPAVKSERQRRRIRKGYLA